MLNDSGKESIVEKNEEGIAMSQTGIDSEEQQLNYNGSDWKGLYDAAALGGLFFVTACGPLTAFADVDFSEECDLYSNPWLLSTGVESGEVHEEIGTSPRDEAVQFDYIEQEYDLEDLSETLSSQSRGFTKEEASDYGDFLDSMFE